jgi:hypothetical protein
MSPVTAHKITEHEAGLLTIHKVLNILSEEFFEVINI